MFAGFQSRPLPLLAVMVLFAGLVPALGDDRGDSSGHVEGRFAIDGCEFEPTHVYALSTDSLGDEATLLIFTDRPLDLGLAYAFDAMQSAAEELTLGEDRAKKGLTLTIVNRIGNHHFWCEDSATGSTAQVSGSEGAAELELSELDAERVSGTWRFDGSPAAHSGRSWSLQFAVDIADPAAAAKPLPSGGGKAGKAYLRYTKDLKKGDVPALRAFINNPWYLTEDATEQEIADDLELMRSQSLSDLKIRGGLADDTAAIVEIEGVKDGSTTRRQVLLKLHDGRWTYGGARPSK